MIQEITTENLSRLFKSKNVRIIDTRPVEAYNGWKLGSEKRRGHIAEAKSLPAKWLNYIDWIEIVRHKNILPEHNIVIYGYSPHETLEVANRFQKSGYTKISVYHHFEDEWSSHL